MESQTKKPTRNTIITMGTLSGLVTMTRKVRVEHGETREAVPMTSMAQPPALVHRRFDQTSQANNTKERVNDHWGYERKLTKLLTASMSV